jgi:tRNA G10  N-methylase Trm11
MKIDSSFFLENKEVIGLWFILSIVGLFIFEIICEIVDQKIKQRKIKKIKEAKRRQAIYEDALKWRKQQREIEYKEFRKTFKKQYINYVVNF